MIIYVKNGTEKLTKGELVAFVTGEKSVNSIPMFLRIGEVVAPEDYEVKELATGKLWKLYSGNIIQVGEGIPLKGVYAKIEFKDYI